MPKEICHFLVAQDVLGKLNDSPYRESCEMHPRLVLLGAIFHDALYYDLSKESVLAKCGDILHAVEGQDSFVILRELKSIAQQQREPSIFLSFLVGIASHICTDIRFHPFVFAFTGDYYATNKDERFEAQSLHRQFESHLDLLLAGPRITAPEFQIRQLLRQEQDKMRRIFEALTRSSSIFSGVSSKAILTAYRRYALAQKLYQNQTLMAVSRKLRRFLPRPMNQALADLGTLRTGSSLDNEFGFIADEVTFAHPVSNEQMRVKVSLLRELASKDTLDVIAHLDSPQYGASLDTGLNEVSVSALQYFDVVHRKRIKEFVGKRI